MVPLTYSKMYRKIPREKVLNITYFEMSNYKTTIMLWNITSVSGGILSASHRIGAVVCYEQSVPCNDRRGTVSFHLKYFTYGKIKILQVLYFDFTKIL